MTEMSFYRLWLVAVHFLLRIIFWVCSYWDVVKGLITRVVLRLKGGNVQHSQGVTLTGANDGPQPFLYLDPGLRAAVFTMDPDKKRPHHLAVIVAENDLCYPVLASIVVWCLALHIPNVSIYDHQGILKKNREKLKASINVKKSELLLDNFKSDYIFQHRKTNGSSNGYLKDHDKLCVNLLSSDDGYNDIAFTARKLATQVKQKDLSSTNITIDLLKKSLNSNRSLPSPDLLICCGSTYSTIGFLPWHIHLTEILNLKTHHQLTLETFIRLLHRFTKCEQRFGK